LISKATIDTVSEHTRVEEGYSVISNEFKKSRE
jgi:hypothetical protein